MTRILEMIGILKDRNPDHSWFVSALIMTFLILAFFGASLYVLASGF